MAKAPNAGWARLSAGIIHDPDWLALDAAGRLVFMTGIALAKAANRDGELSLRAMTGVMVGALTPRQVQRAADDLVAIGLWEGAGHPDRYRVTGFLQWNESTGEQDARRGRKITGAHRTNHQLGRHTEPEPDCPDCAKRDARANARATEPANAIAVAIDRSDVDIDVDETLTRGDPPQPQASPSAPSDGLAAVVVADSLMPLIGYFDQQAPTDLLRYVERALAQGHDVQQIEDCAADVAAMPPDQVETTPLKVLVGLLRKLSNGRPTERAGDPSRPGHQVVKPGSDWSQQWALMTGNQSFKATDQAKAAWHMTRQTRKYDTELNAKFAFRDAYLAAEVTA